jgi:hypothetical protein
VKRLRRLQNPEIGLEKLLMGCVARFSSVIRCRIDRMGARTYHRKTQSNCGYQNMCPWVTVVAKGVPNFQWDDKRRNDWSPEPGNDEQSRSSRQ